MEMASGGGGYRGTGVWVTSIVGVPPWSPRDQAMPADSSTERPYLLLLSSVEFCVPSRNIAAISRISYHFQLFQPLETSRGAIGGGEISVMTVRGPTNPVVGDSVDSQTELFVVCCSHPRVAILRESLSMPRVLVAPAPLREIEFVYGPILREAGLTIEYPPRNDFRTELQMSEAELLAQLPGCVASLAGSEPYTRSVIEKAAAAGLKVIARAGVGYDAVDLAAATDCGVVVCYAPGTNQEAVAEHTFMLMLGLVRKLREQDTEIRRGLWPRRAVGHLRGNTLGIIGLGRIGKAVAQRAIPFGLRVIATDIAPDEAFAKQYGIAFVPLEELLRTADIVTLHVPKTPLTRNLIHRDTLALMKPTAYLINTSRGGVVKESDLYEALTSRRIAGAGLDVYESEPPGDNPLFQLDNILVTAHTAGVDERSRQEMARVPAQAIVQLLAGQWPAEWIVNPQVREKFFSRH